MNIIAERKKTEAVLDTYRAWIDKVSDERFAETPPGGGWSYAEVYSHIMQATLGSTIALERCTQKTCKPTNKGANWLGKAILFFGMFPPGIRTKQPAKVAERMPAIKISKEEARNYIIKCRQRLDAMVALMLNLENDGRVAHPRLGMLSAGQWLKFIRIHLNHHLKQLKRIEKKF
ncbi:DinB family protein [Mucilaginibacter myungsuensis]|uniref:DinB family protein n=1 Tax=Mucilaginibacter myungsuensis TaxID=649104 RepID=A0A929PWK7_9SPHI|nr:DinB family protein [Mucilaginibacter myungsuensis]MBE9661460.1 DinB family protein [Mucilaginibacter myungsuensis]MDN3597603.1 DinB family protein [Mucilaginibacter myungsuensis]